MAGVARKYRRLRSQRDLRHEYRKLRRLLPQPDKARGKVAVVDAAHAYILQLQTALLDQLSSRGQHLIPKGARGSGDVANVETVRSLAIRLIRSRASARSSKRSSSEARAPSSTTPAAASRSLSSPPECSSSHPSIRPSTSGTINSSSSAAPRSLAFEAGTSTNQKSNIAFGKNFEEGKDEGACGSPSSPSTSTHPSSTCTSASSSTSSPASVTSSTTASRRKSGSVVLET